MSVYKGITYIYALFALLVVFSGVAEANSAIPIPLAGGLIILTEFGGGLWLISSLLICVLLEGYVLSRSGILKRPYKDVFLANVISTALGTTLSFIVFVFLGNLIFQYGLLYLVPVWVFAIVLSIYIEYSFLSRKGKKKQSGGEGKIRRAVIEGNIFSNLIIILLYITIVMLVPSGERGAKLRTLESDAKNSVVEVKHWLGLFAKGKAILTIDARGEDMCIEYVNSAENKTCKAMYHIDKANTYGSINDIVMAIVDFYKFKNVLSPYNYRQFLFVADEGIDGTIVLNAVDDRSVSIRGYVTSTDKPIFDTVVAANK